MLPLSALTEMKVLLGTPCYGSATTHLYSTSLFTLASMAVRSGLEISLEMNGTSDVFTARNQMATMVLQRPELTHLFFVDADIGFTPEAFIRLLVADKDVVAGLYPLKTYNWPDKLRKDMTREEFERLYTPYPFAPVGTESDQHGFVEVSVATTGFMCIKRHVLERMTEQYPDWQYFDRKPDGRRVGPIWDFFDQFRVGHERFTEDYAFCKLWRDIGGQVFVDLVSKLDHLGQHIFRGDLHGSLLANSPHLAEVA